MLFDDISVEEIAEIRAEEAREEGIEIGREKGLAEGRQELHQEKLAIARNLLTDGSSPEYVSKITGLSLEDITKL